MSKIYRDDRYVDNDSFSNDSFFFKITPRGSDKVMMCYKEGQDIIFKTDFVSAQRIAYCRYEDKFIFTFHIDNIIGFLKQFYTEDQIYKEPEPQYARYRNSIRKDYCVNYVQFIDNWKRLIVHPDGTFDLIEDDFVPYTIPLIDAYDNVHRLFIKYKTYIESHIDNFIPTITGGADSRILCCLYRDKADQIPGFYLRDYKNDGKNNIDLGRLDLECAYKLAERLGIKEHYNILPEGNLTMSGVFTENLRGMYGQELNDPKFFYEVIKHDRLQGNFIKPFKDELFVSIKQPSLDTFRCLALLLVSPDLMDLPFNGTKKLYEKYNGQPYDFFKENEEAMKEAKHIMEVWGKEKCENILNPNY